MSTSQEGQTPQTLLEMHLPEFRRGYDSGRRNFFENKDTLTDKELMVALETMFNEDENEGAPFLVGQLIGRISALVIPRQPHEDTHQERQQRLLDELLRQYGSGEETKALIDSITRFWAIQDSLAERLDIDVYDRVLHRNSSPVLKYIG